MTGADKKIRHKGRNSQQTTLRRPFVFHPAPRHNGRNRQGGKQVGGHGIFFLTCKLLQEGITRPVGD
ncbi:hypothetical protein [Erwinia mallotivora]|uniref:hypothetical protein n=1 Tax=Erwinia mallotivora TaxID=69222 RepID=UPI0021BE088D|nr:hypothetical protein [Erwinia mallotivora]